MLPPKAQTFAQNAGQGSGQVQIQILRRDRLQTAPAAIFFRARVSGPGLREAPSPTRYDETWSGLRYEWRFGDPGAASGKVVNLPRAHNDLNIAYGKEVAHVFRRPGRHRIHCEVRGPEGLIGAHSTEIWIEDPERAFPGARTILLDPEGRGSTAYPEARIVRDFETALQASRQTPGGATRILVRRGTRLSLLSELSLRSPHGALLVGTYGTGARPQLRILSGRAVFDLRPDFNGQLTLQGLDLAGPWDAVTETGAQGDRRIDGIRCAPGNGPALLLDDCRLDGFGNAVLIQGSPEANDPGFFTLHDCDITNWGDYGILASPNLGNAIALLGCAIHQHPQAMQGGHRKDRFSHNEHGPVRMAGPGHFHMDACDLFSRNGWTRLASVPADQPCLRWNTKALAGRSGTVTRTAMEGGFTIVALTDENTNGTRYLSNFLMEKCLLVGSASTIIGVALQFTGQTIRNNVIVMPDVPRASVRWQTMISAVDGDNPAGQQDPGVPVQVYSNTLIQRRRDAYHDRPMDAQRGMEDFEVFSFENNLFATPNTSQPGGERDLTLGRGAIETVGGTWTPRFAGLKYQPEQRVMDPSFATPGDQLQGLVPVGEVGIGDAMGLHALDDFFGLLRPDPPDRGAIET